MKLPCAAITNVERATKNGDFKMRSCRLSSHRKKANRPSFSIRMNITRPGLTMEQLKPYRRIYSPKSARLQQAIPQGLTTGASAMIINVGGKKAKELGLKANRHDTFLQARGGCHPSVMGLSPVPAVKNLLKNDRASPWTHLNMLEVNEAFGRSVPGCEKELGFKP